MVLNILKKCLYGIWTFPNTLMGLSFLIFARNGSVKMIDGALEIESPLIDRVFRRITNTEGRLLAFTLGQVVIGSSKTVLLVTRPHERIHVRQYERWGIFFLPAYVVASCWATWQGKHPYTENRFERDAST